MEDVLTKRIKLREDEIKRLNEDHEAHAKTVSMRTREVARLRAELERTVYLGTALTYFDTESEVELPIPQEEITAEELGEIFVDSASILITDPLYVQREWNSDEEYTDSRQYRYVETGKVYTFGEEFVRYDEPLPDLGKTPQRTSQERNASACRGNTRIDILPPGSHVRDVDFCRLWGAAVRCGPHRCRALRQDGLW